MLKNTLEKGWPRARRLALWVLCASTVLAGEAFAQAATTPGGAKPRLPAAAPRANIGAEPLFPIPPAIDRPLGAEEGERLFVNQFQLRGSENRPGLGVNLDELQTLLEDLRVERQGLNKIDEDGFTKEEKSLIAEFMRKVVNAPDLDMNFEEYEGVIDQLRAEKAQREAGMTIGQMQQIANAVTEYYRSAGFILAQAFIPAQEVVDGTVTIEVLEGKLGNVLAEGNEAYSNEVLARPFEDLIDAPVTVSEVESALLTASDLPGLSVFGTFQPGQEIGSTDLVLKVQDEDPWSASVRYDNSGTRFTGERRIFGTFTWNNPSGVGDVVNASLLQQYRPKNSAFGSIEYQRPLIPGLVAGIGYERNPFSIGAEVRGTDLSGENAAGRLFLRQSFIRSRNQNISGRLGFERSVAIQSRAKRRTARDDLAFLSGEVSYDSIDQEHKAINFATFGVNWGLGEQLGGVGNTRALRNSAGAPNTLAPGRVGGSTKVGSNDFSKLYGTFSRLQIMSDTQQLLFRSEGQWATDLLASTQQYSIGGPDSVRAFNVSNLLVDSAAFASAEYSFAAPFIHGETAFRGLTWGEVLRVSFFADWAYGKINDPAVGQESSNVLAGFGAGVSFNLPGEFQGRVQVAHPFGKALSTVNGGTEATKWWFDFTYQF